MGKVGCFSQEGAALGRGNPAILRSTRLLPQTRSGRRRPQSRVQRDSEHPPISAKALALSLPQEAWQTVAWREGSAERLSSRFARQRVRAAHRDTELSQPRAEEWLLIEWPENETEPTKYW